MLRAVLAIFAFEHLLRARAAVSVPACAAG
jgi:hypothetical protein